MTFIRVFGGSDNGALQVSTQKKGFCLTESVNCRPRSNVGFRSASHGSGRNTRVRPQRHVSSLGKCANGAFVVEYDHKIGHLRTDLRSPTGTAPADERRPPPTMFGSRYPHSFPTLSPN